LAASPRRPSRTFRSVFRRAVTDATVVFFFWTDARLASRRFAAVVIDGATPSSQPDACSGRCCSGSGPCRCRRADVQRAPRRRAGEERAQAGRGVREMPGTRLLPVGSISMWTPPTGSGARRMCDEQIWPQTGAKVYNGAGPRRPKWKSRMTGGGTAASHTTEATSYLVSESWSTSVVLPGSVTVPTHG
jgi:hypothetical protein